MWRWRSRLKNHYNEFVDSDTIWILSYRIWEYTEMFIREVFIKEPENGEYMISIAYPKEYSVNGFVNVLYNLEYINKDMYQVQHV